LFSNNNKN